MEDDKRVLREHELVRLHPAERGVAIRELPLLPDHLDREGGTMAGRKSDRVRPLTAAGAVLQELVRSEPCEEEHHRRRDHHPEQLDAGVVPDWRTLECRLVPAGVELDESVGEKDDHETED